MGYTSLEDFLVGFWEGFFLDRRDPNNLLTMLWTWQQGDIGQTPGFDGDRSRRSTRSRRRRSSCRPRRTSTSRPRTTSTRSGTCRTRSFRVIPGVWGHFAGGGANPVDTDFIDRGLRDLLAD
jgi:homoserine O-acetyltransferase